MLENRSFDHMLGFSGIEGVDAASGSATAANGFTPLSLRIAMGAFGQNSVSGIVQKKRLAWPPAVPFSTRSLITSNGFHGASYPILEGADYAMPVDPHHEFTDVVTQLCGQGVSYIAKSPYPPVLNDGFVASYSASGGQSQPGEVMKCYTPAQLPVLNALASEFALCDNWHASLPGPTWPNRFFAHAASSGGLDHSPSSGDILKWDSIAGFSFPQGTIFDRMNASSVNWRIYAGDSFPVVGALKGINILEISDYSDLARDVSRAGYPASYTFIEPNYGHFLSDYKCGTSQHPLDDVTRGETLIKTTYEIIRNSPIWNNSMLIVTWDEHGGFFDHLPPPAAIAPGDTAPDNGNNQYGFTFQQYGPRVPAVVISPLIPRNVIDHRLFDHSSIPAAVEASFGLTPLTQRDAHSNQLLRLASLSTPRTDTPASLPAAAQSGVTGCDPVQLNGSLAAIPPAAAPVVRPADSIDEGNVPGFLFVALRSHLALSPPEEAPAIRARFAAVRNRSDAADYLNEVHPKVRNARAQVFQRHAV